LLDFFLRGMHCSWAWRKWRLKSDKHSWTPQLEASHLLLHRTCFKPGGFAYTVWGSEVNMKNLMVAVRVQYPNMGSHWTCWSTNLVSQCSCSWETAGTHSLVPVLYGKVHLQVTRIGFVDTCPLQAAACPVVFHCSSCCRSPSSKPWSSILEMSFFL